MTTKSLSSRAAVIVAALAIFCLTACSLFDLDASAYTKSCLDATLKGDFAEYTKITHISQEEAEKDRQTELDNDYKELFAGITVTEETKQKFYSLLSDIYSKCRYEVGEYVKNDDGSYTVPVKTYKMIVFKNSTEEASKRIKEYTKNQKKRPTAEAVTEKYMEFLHEILTENLEKAQYEQPQTTQITVAKSGGKKGSYGITADQLTRVYESLMDTDAMFEEQTQKKDSSKKESE